VMPVVKDEIVIVVTVTVVDGVVLNWVPQVMFESTVVKCMP
jgi:hypothetical protein